MRRRRLNWKGLLILSVAGLTLMAGVFFLHRFQVRNNSEALYDRAQSSLTDPALSTQKQLATAIDYLKRYLGFQPKSRSEALFELANLRAHEKIATNPKARLEAMLALDHALRHNPPGREKERRRLIDLALDLGRTSDARTHAQILLDADPNNSDLLALMGRCDNEAAQYASARKFYEAALNKPNPAIDTYARLAGLLRNHADDVRDPARKEKPDDVVLFANARIAEMVGRNPTSARAYLARATYLRLFPDSLEGERLMQAVEKDILKARELAGDDPDVLMSLADLAQFRRSPDLARRYLRQGCSRHPDNWRLHLALADLERDDGKLDDALAVLRQGLTSSPEQPDLLWSLANLYLARGARDDFEKSLARLRAASMPPPEIDFLRGRFAFLHKDWPEASARLTDAFEGLKGRIDGGRNTFVLALARDAGLLLGQACEKLGDPDRAYLAYSRVATLAPQSSEARLGMAKARRNTGQLADAIEHYRQLLRLPGAPADAAVELARLTLNRNADRDAPDWAEVDRALVFAERLRPLPAEVVMMRLEALAAQQKTREARDYLNSLLVQPRRMLLPAPRLEQVVTALFWQQEKLPAVYFVARSALAESDRKPDEALDWLEQGAREYDDPIYLRIARAAQWARRGGAAAGKALSQLEGDLDRYTPEERRRLLTSLAESHRALQQPAEEKRVWERVVEVSRDDLNARVALFDLALEARDEPAMQRQGRAIQEIEGDAGVRWRYAEARRAILRAERDDGRADALDEARKHLRAVAVRRSTWSRVPLCEALIAELEGKPDAAADKYLEAFKKGERAPAALARTFEVLHARGRAADAQLVLRKVPRQALSGDQLRLAAESMVSRNPGESVRLADAALAASPKDSRQYLWAGRIYWGAGQALKAEATLRRACDLSPSHPEAWVVLAYFLVGSGQKDAAIEARSQMANALPEKSAPLAHAQCHEILGEKEKAEPCYAKALTAGPDDLPTLRAVSAYYLRNGRLKEADPLLARLKVKARAKAPALAGWADNALKVIRVAGADYQEVQKTLASIGRPDALPANADRQSVADQRVRAALLARQPSRKNHEEAVRIYENLVSLQEATAEDLFQLARLHERLDNWKKASARLETLVNLPAGQNPAYLAHYARGLLKNDRLEQAAVILERLEKLDQARFVTAEIRARLLFKQGKAKEALALITARPAGADDLVPTASLLEEFGDAEGAEKLLLANVESSGRLSAASVLISFYARQKQGDKALDRCETVWQQLPAEDAVDLCMQVVMEAPEDAGLLGRVEKLLAGKRGDANSSAVTTAVGHLRVLQGRDAEAGQIYRLAIERNEKDILARNALAWLLTMQRNKGQEAFEQTRRAVEVGGPYPWLLDTQALALMAMGQTDRAITLLEEVVAEAPTGVSYFHLAKAYHLARKEANARSALNRARKEGLKPGDLHPSERAELTLLHLELKVQ